MEFIDIDEEVARLQREEGDMGLGRAIVIATLFDAYPDLKLFRDCWGQIRHCSKSINAKVEKMAIDSCHRCDGKPIKAWPYVVVGTAGERLYSDPPAFIISDQNQEGFGEHPRAGWLEAMQAAGIGESVIKEVEKHLRGHPPIDYFGDDDEAKGDSRDRGADVPPDVVAK